MQREPKSIMRDWVTERCTIQMQGTLLTGVRGPDNVRKYHPIKGIIRAYRACILNPAKGYPDSFAGDGSHFGTKEMADAWFEFNDELPHHWQLHMIHCAEIIGYKHPDRATREWWIALYFRMVEDLHLCRESLIQMETRLAGDGLEP
jgi:hypothetical protein